MKTRFSEQIIDLFEALAPTDIEILDELCGTPDNPLTVELTSNGNHPESRFSDQFRLAAAPMDKAAVAPKVARERRQESLGSVHGERGRCIFSQLNEDVYTLFDNGDCPTLLELIGVKPSSFTLLPSDKLPGLLRAEGLTVEMVRKIVKMSNTGRKRVLAKWS